MDCESSRTWIWESLRDTERPPDDVEAHLAACPACREEHQARQLVGRDLRALRHAHEVEPPVELDLRALEAAHAAVAAQQTGRFRFDIDLDGLGEDLDPQTLSEIDVAIARDLADTGRVAVRPQWQPPPPQEPPAPAHAWQPPRATATWLATAAAVLVAAVALGFIGGRLSAPQGVHATLATTSGALLSTMPRLHSVGLSRDAVDTLNNGNTYLLAGPVGGPYEVVGVVRWDEADILPVPSDDGGEIVVAVGPPGGWSRGKQLALNDLHAADLEILGRRMVDRVH